MKEAMDILELLASQHAEVDQLIEKLEGDDADRDEVFAEMADKLAAHATVEETIFYPAAMSKTTSEQLHEAVEEHLAVKRVLADMLDLDPESDEFDAKLAILKEQVSHHAHDEEEGKLFPKLRREMDADTRAALANEVLARFEELITQEPRRNVPAETSEAAPLPGG
jgi:iron-sulfur cluster repair protein YtfE (RIC family)